MRFFKIKNSLFFHSRTDFVKHFLRGARGKILDVGNLGDGVVNVNVAGIIDSNKTEYFGLDVNKNLSDALSDKRQLVGDLHDLSGVVKNESFDYIYAGEIIEHTWSPGKMIRECNRILKEKGRLILDTPNVYDAISIFRVLFLKRDTLGDVEYLTYNEAKDNFGKLRKDKNLYTQPQHKIFYSPASIVQLLNMHGFQVKAFVYIGKPRGPLHRLLLKLFPQASQKMGVVAEKTPIDIIYDKVLRTHNVEDK